MMESEVAYLQRHLRDFKQFEFEERTLRECYEQALEEITRQFDNTSVNRAKEIANEALGELTAEKKKVIRSYESPKPSSVVVKEIKVKCPQLIFNGDSLNVDQIKWDKGGEVESVCFYDKEGKFQTAFQVTPNSLTNQGIIYLDFKTALVTN